LTAESHTAAVNKLSEIWIIERIDCGPMEKLSLNRPPASHQVDYQHHHSHNEQQVDQAATDVREHANQPQDQQNYQNCPQHGRISLILYLPRYNMYVSNVHANAPVKQTHKPAGNFLHHNHPLFHPATRACFESSQLRLYRQR
jgi:hypothetical protein